MMSFRTSNLGAPLTAPHIEPEKSMISMASGRSPFWAASAFCAPAVPEIDSEDRQREREIKSRSGTWEHLTWEEEGEELQRGGREEGGEGGERPSLEQRFDGGLAARAAEFARKYGVKRTPPQMDAGRGGKDIIFVFQTYHIENWHLRKDMKFHLYFSSSVTQCTYYHGGYQMHSTHSIQFIFQFICILIKYSYTALVKPNYLQQSWSCLPASSKLVGLFISKSIL